jgi:hypothetical protein
MEIFLGKANPGFSSCFAGLDLWAIVAFSLPGERSMNDSPHFSYANIQLWSDLELQLTVRESQSRGSGASLDVPEGSMLPTTLLPGA